MILSSCAMVGFLTGMAALTPSTKGLGIGLSLVGSFCVGFIELTSLAVAPLFCAPEDIGLAVGLISAIRSLGGSISGALLNVHHLQEFFGLTSVVTVYVAIRDNRLLATLPNAIYPAALEAGYPSSRLPQLLAAVNAGKLSKLPDATSAVIAAVQKAAPIGYSQAYKTVYLASLAFGAIALMGSVFSKDPEKHLNDNITRKLHGRDIKETNDG
jgi:Fungal trichothecene efflux pump (TRI12)